MLYKNNKLALYLILSLSFLSVLIGCKAKHSAIIQNNQSLYFSRHGEIQLIKPKETQPLKDLAIQQDIPASQLAQFNGLREDDIVYEGAIIKIPPGSFYQVKPGESLKDVAKVYDVSVKELALQNKITNPRSLTPGEYIRIPGNLAAYDEAEAEAFYKNIPRFIGNEETKKRQDVDDYEVEHTYQDSTDLGTEALKYFKTKTPLNSRNFIWPLYGKVIRHYSNKSGDFDKSIAIAAVQGTSIKAAGNGRVIYVGKPDVYGNLVILDHDDGYMTAYAHNSKILVKKGQNVKKGEVIAKVGSTGKAKTPQLQFSIRKGKKTIDPEAPLK